MKSSNYKKNLEARVGIEPTHKGFADLSLTTWVPRPNTKASSYGRKKSSHELSIITGSYALPKGFSVGPVSGIITASLCPAKMVTFPANPIIHRAKPAFTVAPGTMLPARIPLHDPTHQATVLVI